MFNYSSQDIVTLDAGRAFREKIGMYLSADKQEAINLGLRELIINVQDEYEVYKPKNPFLKIFLNTKTKEITVSDNMRGIPVGIRQDGINSLTAAFLIPHSGGKHREGVYSSAVGINGEGNKVVCHTASFLEVTVKRDKNIYFQRFESDENGAKAIKDVEIIGECGEETGTTITYKPDPQVYGDVFIDLKKLKEMLIEISLFTIGLRIELYVDNLTPEIFLSKNGLVDGLKKDNAISSPFSYFYETKDCKVEMALQWVKSNGNIKGYANGLYMPNGGAFLSGFKSSFTKTFNNLTNKNYSGEFIRQFIDGIVSVKVKFGQFSNQAKTSLANPEARTATSIATTTLLKEQYNKNPQNIKNIVELIEKMQKAEQAAEKVKNTILNATTSIEKIIKNKNFFSDKLKDAKKLGKDSILLICEGKSAVNALALGRDPNKYGLLEIRGKIINCLTNPMEKIMENEEIRLIFSALGVTSNNYQPEKLRYGKVGIATDADKDGNHIALLLLCFFSEMLPNMLKENRIMRLHSPTHIIKTKNKDYYYFSDEEFQKRKIKGETIQVKGLGELTSDQIKTAMFGELQHLVPFDWNNENDQLLRNFMGNDVEFRKNFLFHECDFSQIIE